MNPILAYMGFGPDGALHEYCEQDALQVLFAGQQDRLEAVKQGTENTFLDSHGHFYSLIFDAGAQCAVYPDGLLSVEGVYCAACGAELLPPVALPF